MSPLDRWPVASYVTITYAFSWLAWGASSLPDSQISSFVLVILGGFGPMIGALTMVHHHGEEAIGSWLRSQLHFRGPVRWYAVAFVIPLIYPIALTAYLVATGVPIESSVLPARIPMFLASLGFVFLLGGGQEEFGWRGYMLPRLLERWSAGRASLVLGVVWACWHLPLYVIPGQLYASKPFLSYLPLVVALTFVFTWLHDAANHRLPVVMLLHAGVNSTGALVPVRPEHLSGFSNSHTASLVMLVATLAVLAAIRLQSGTWLPGTRHRDRGTGVL